MNMTNRPLYRIIKFFIGGNLEGLTYSETTSVKFEVGFECGSPFGGSPYRIVSVEEVKE